MLFLFRINLDPDVSGAPAEGTKPDHWKRIMEEDDEIIALLQAFMQTMDG